MTRFLQRLGARAVDGLARVEPRLASRFETAQPGPATSAPLVAEDADAESEPPAPRPSPSPAEAGSGRATSPIGSRAGSSLERKPTPAPPPARDSAEGPRPAHPDSAGDPGEPPAPRTRARARVLAANHDAFDSASPDRRPAPAPASPESAEADERFIDPGDTPAPDAPAGPAASPESRLRRLESALAALESEVSELPGDPASGGSSTAVGGSGRDPSADLQRDGREPAERARFGEAPPPEVHLHIGRIIVRAQQPGPAAAATRGRSATEGIGGTLEQYLARRSRGTL